MYLSSAISPPNSPRKGAGKIDKELGGLNKLASEASSAAPRQKSSSASAPRRRLTDARVELTALQQRCNMRRFLQC
ncbi:MAG: hypothetical protein ACLSAH_10540 [Bilophila wadsworthia]